MTTTHRLVADLLDAVDSTEGEYIRIPKTDAVRIAELLVKAQFVAEAPSLSNGKILFFCPTCEKSFSAEGREDKESGGRMSCLLSYFRYVLGFSSEYS